MLGSGSISALPPPKISLLATELVSGKGISYNSSGIKAGFTTETISLHNFRAVN
jgi:hypothetical protein